MTINLRIKHRSQAAVRAWADKQIEKPTSVNYIAVLLSDENCEKLIGVRRMARLAAVIGRPTHADAGAWIAECCTPGGEVLKVDARASAEAWAASRSLKLNWPEFCRQLNSMTDINTKKIRVLYGKRTQFISGISLNAVNRTPVTQEGVSQLASATLNGPKKRN